MSRSARWAGVVASLSLICSSCAFEGIENVSLPGGRGTGDGAVIITADLPDVGTLTENAQVKVDDVAVGTVTDLRVDDWHAVAELSLEPDVALPANAVAAVGVNSVLGAAYVELAPPPTKARGTLETGAHIPLVRGHAYPSTEQVLSAASLALNGGGLEQLSTITAELNNVLGGHDRAVRDLLPRLDSFVGAVNAQRSDIFSAMRDIDRLARRFGSRRGDIEGALDVMGPALRTLADSRPKLTQALAALSELGTVATPLVRRVKGDLIANLKDLEPVLRALREADKSLVRGLGYAMTMPFPPDMVTKSCAGDYCNMFLALDLTNQSLIDGFLQPGSIGPPGLPGMLSGKNQQGRTAPRDPPLPGPLGGNGDADSGIDVLDGFLEGLGP